MNKFCVMDSLDPFEVEIGDKLYEVLLGIGEGSKFFPSFEKAKVFAESYHDEKDIKELIVDWDFIDSNCYTQCQVCGKLTFRMHDIYCSECDDEFDNLQQ